MIIVSICLSDIPAEKRTKSDKNGKTYASIVVDERRDGEDKYGNTHMVYMSQTKEERTAKATRVFVGNGKEFKFDGSRRNAETAPAATSNNAAEGEDLPF